jgi:hypothetical protein
VRLSDEHTNHNFSDTAKLSDEIQQNKMLARVFSKNKRRSTDDDAPNSELRHLLRRAMAQNKGEAQEAQAQRNAQRLLLNARVSNVISNILFTANAMAVMVVGVGVKLALYDPTAPTNAHFALQQRLGLGVPVAVVFAVQLINSSLRNRHHYACSKALTAHPEHMCVLAARLLLLGVKVGVCFLPLRPVLFVALQAFCALVRKGAPSNPSATLTRAAEQGSPATLLR